MGRSTYILGQGDEHDRQSISLGTHRTKHIENEVQPEWSPEQLAYAIETVKNTNPEAILRSASAIYNCVGMVFATRRTSVEPKFVTTFLEDDDYSSLDSIVETELVLTDSVVWVE